MINEMEKIFKIENRNWIYFTSPLINDEFYKNKKFITNDKIVKEFYKEF